MTPTERVIDALRELGCEPKRQGNGWTARCPAHEDRTPSLAVSTGDDGRALVHCHASCETGTVVAALGLEMGQLFDSSPKKRSEMKRKSTADSRPSFASASAAAESLRRKKGDWSGYWTYTDANGDPVGLVLRWDNEVGEKEIRPVSRIDGSWVVGAMPEPRVLYNLPVIRDEHRIYVTEGEKCADALASLGLAATTSCGGAKAAVRTDWGPLAGKEVIILPDCDDAGQSYAQTVVTTLQATEPVPTVRVVNLPGLDEGEDVVDWLAKHPNADPEDARKRIEVIVDETSSPANSFHPVLSLGGRNEWHPIPLPELGPAEPVDWVLPGFLACGYTTLFTALWKSGKTTFISNLLHDLQQGGGLVGEPFDRPILVISEEATGHWVRRRDELGLGQSIHLLAKPFRARPVMNQWLDFVDAIEANVRGGIGYGLVVIDTLPSVWPVNDENDASGVNSAVMPLQTIAQAGAGVLLTHHPRKSGGTEGRAARGSGALAGAVDIVVDMERRNADDPSNTQRVLKTMGRFVECEPEVVIDYTEEGYRIIGARQDADESDRLRVITSILEAADEPMTADEVREKYPPPGISKRGVRGTLNYGAAHNQWQRFGTGVKGDAYRFWPAGRQFRVPACAEGEDAA